MKWWPIGLVVIAVIARCTCAGQDRREQLRVVSYNIEHFPQTERQVRGAFDEIEAVHANLVGAQEITDPSRFVIEARARLGPTWSFIHDTWRVPNHHHIGLLYDTAVWTLDQVVEHDDTRFGPRDHGVLEIRLVAREREREREREDDPAIRVLLIHFRPTSAGLAVRVQQHAALARIAARAVATGDRVIVLGDFNATEPGDRVELARLASAAKLVWATEPLACTAFWIRPDGCPRSRLDHVLMSATPIDVNVHGACARHGCDWQASCPREAHEVSDHCPISVDF